MPEHFNRPQPAECSILGLSASVLYQVGSKGSVILSRPSEGEDFEITLPFGVLVRLFEAADAADAMGGDE